MHPTEKTQKIFFADKFSLFARLGIGILSVLFLSLIISRLAFPFDNGILEAFNWMPAQHILEGKNPYAFALTPPYSMTPYGAVFYALIAAGQKLFGFQLWWGRLLTVLAFAFCLWAVVKITKKITGEKEAAFVAFLAGLAMFPSQFWIGAVRPDLIAFAFAAGAAWLIFTRVEENEKTPVPVIAGIVLLSCAAFFTKQTFFLTAGIAFLRFLQVGKPREAFLTAAVFAALAATGIFLLNYTSGGGYVWQHWTHAQRLTFSWSQVVFELLRILKTPVFSLALVFLLVFIYRGRKSLFPVSGEKLLDILRSPLSLILFYFSASLGWAFVSSGRVGANMNYYIESSLLLSVVCGVVYANFRRNYLPKLALAMIVLFTLGGAFQLARILHGERYRWQALGYYREILDRTRKTVSSQPMADSVCISVAAELVVRSGCRFHFDDFSEYEHGWSPELREIFEREVKTGRYAAILWYDDRLDARFPNYRLVPVTQAAPERSFPVYLYVPEDVAAAP
jgi:4-amino-4-deoxy-L-arabinose transferase-like glycosyltransferase